LVGQPVSLIEKSTKARVAFVTRLGEGMIPTENTVLQEGDLVHVMVTDDEISSVEATLAKSPEEA
jgi:trk system potassium uptake protein TrkA